MKRDSSSMILISDNKSKYNNQNGISQAKQQKMYINSELIYEKLWKDWNLVEIEQLNGTTITHNNGKTKLNLTESRYSYLKFDKSFVTYFSRHYKDIGNFNLSELPHPLPWLYVFIHLKSNLFNVPTIKYPALLNFIIKLMKDDAPLKYAIEEVMNNDNNNLNKLSTTLAYNELYNNEVEHLAIALFFLHQSIHCNTPAEKLKSYNYSTVIDNETTHLLGIITKSNQHLDCTLNFEWHGDVVSNFYRSYMDVNNKTLLSYRTFMNKTNYVQNQFSKAKCQQYTNIKFDQNFILAYTTDDIGFNIQCDDILIDKYKIIEKLKSVYQPLDYSIFALHSPFVLYMYLYLTLKYKFFQLELNNFHVCFDLLLKYDVVVAKHADNFNKNKSIFYLISEILNTLKDESKLFVINGTGYPWNNAIIPAIGRLLVENKKSFTNGARYCDFTQEDNCMEYVDDSSNLTIVPTPQQYKYIGLLDVFPQVESIAQHFFTGNEEVYNLTNHHEDLTDEFIKDWVTRTHNHAIFISGTACVGKSTFLNNIITNIKENYNECATIMKSGRCGGFDGKDEDLILALSLQAMMINYGVTYINCIGDRTPYDNLIWRFIMNLVRFNDTNVMLTEFVRSFSKLSPVLLQLIGQEPYIFLINTNVCKIREMMKTRNNGNDSWRADVYRYVEIQNMVYGVFAKLTGCLLFDLAQSDNRIPDRIQTLINEKCKSNSKIVGKITRDDVDNIHRVDVGAFKNIIPDCTENYECAKVLKIYK